MNILRNIALEDFFSVTLKKYGKNFRKVQLDLAQDIKNAFIENKVFIAEAEVGTGKTYAYLIPSINHIYETNKPLLISTGTIALQEQLINKDIPDVNKYLKTESFISKDIVSYIGKGKEHYICEQRLAECNLQESGIQLIKNKYETDNIFDKSDIKFKLDEKLWKKINVRNCNRYKCKYRDCLYRKIKVNQENYNYDILVCNHQYFIACLKNNNHDFINKFSGIVIDEAHNFEQAAFSILGDSKSLDDFLSCLNRVHDKLYGFKISNNIYNAMDLAKRLYEKIKLNTKIPVEIEYAEQHDVNLDKEIQDISYTLYEQLEVLLEEVSIHYSFSNNKKTENTEYALSNEIQKLTDFLWEISKNSNDNVWWVQFDSNKPKLFNIPKNINEILHRVLFDKKIPIILTSGTMSSEKVISGSESLAFEYFMNNIGAGEISTARLKTPISKKSGFNYKEHGLLYIEKEIKFVKREDEANYTDYSNKLCDRIFNIIKLSKGKTLVLFTSKDAMNYMYDIISGKVKANLGINCLKQGQPNVKYEFETQINSCLFATGAYWEGIDVRGESLSTLIIHKLPFPVPSPIYNFKKKSYGDIQNSEMIVKLKQGAGRLIRDENDKGVLIILDSRANNYPYRKIIRESLPPFRTISNLSCISEFLAADIDNSFKGIS